MLVPVVLVSIVIVIITILFFLIIGYSSSSPSSLSNRRNNDNNSKNNNYKRINKKLNEDDIEFCKKIGLRVDKVNGDDQVIILAMDKHLIDIMNNDNDDNRLKIVNIIKRISQNCILFIIINVHSDDEQVKFHEKILHDIIDDDYLPIHRILFYETDIGKIAIVRQLNPNIYFDNHSLIREKLIPHISDVKDCNQLFDINIVID